MEKKILIFFALFAASLLVWAFHFLGRDLPSSHFIGQTESEMRKEAQSQNISPSLFPLLKTGLAIAENTSSSYVMRPGQCGIDQIDQLRVVVEKPSCTMKSNKECQKHVKAIQSLQRPQFSIESLQVKLSEDVPGEYDFFYQRLSGDWSDLEAQLPDTRREDWLPANWDIFTNDAKTPPSI